MVKNLGSLNQLQSTVLEGAKQCTQKRNPLIKPTPLTTFRDLPVSSNADLTRYLGFEMATVGAVDRPHGAAVIARYSTKKPDSLILYRVQQNGRGGLHWHCTDVNEQKYYKVVHVDLLEQCTATLAEVLLTASATRSAEEAEAVRIVKNLMLNGPGKGQWHLAVKEAIEHCFKTPTIGHSIADAHCRRLTELAHAPIRGKGAFIMTNNVLVIGADWRDSEDTDDLAKVTVIVADESQAIWLVKLQRMPGYWLFVDERRIDNITELDDEQIRDCAQYLGDAVMKFGDLRAGGSKNLIVKASVFVHGTLGALSSLNGTF